MRLSGVSMAPCVETDHPVPRFYEPGPDPWRHPVLVGIDAEAVEQDDGRSDPLLFVVQVGVEPGLRSSRDFLSPELTKRVVGIFVVLLSVRLLLMPVPLSNILPAILSR